MSEDPLFKEYAMLTPYQFASNTPIQAIDIDGKEGETYLEYKIENGKKVILRRIIEVDVYVAITRDENKPGFYSRRTRKDKKILKAVKNDLATEYIDGKFSDGDKHPIVWRFNVKAIYTDDKGIKEYKKELLASGNYFVHGTLDGKEKRGIKALFITTKHFFDLPTKDEREGKWLGVEEIKEYGDFDNFSIVTVNDVSENKTRSHTLGHEVAHFFLRLHPNETITNMGRSPIRHDAAGKGILHYYKINYEVDDRWSGMGTPDTSMPRYGFGIKLEGIEDLNQENVNYMLHSIIDTGQKEVKE